MRSLLDFQQNPRLLRELSRVEAQQFLLALQADNRERSPAPFDLHEYLTQDQGLTKGTQEYALLAHPFEVFVRHLRARASKQVTKPLANFILFLTGGSLTELILYAHALHLGTGRQELISMPDLARLFPHGIPTEESLRTFWEETKTVSFGGDGARSALDSGTAWRIPE